MGSCYGVLNMGVCDAFARAAGPLPCLTTLKAQAVERGFSPNTLNPKLLNLNRRQSQQGAFGAPCQVPVGHVLQNLRCPKAQGKSACWDVGCDKER